MAEADASQTRREIAALFDVSISTVSDHLKQIRMVEKLDKWVPHEKKEHQMTRRLEIYCSLLSWYQSEPFFASNCFV